MKKAVVLALALIASNSMACPNFEGVYSQCRHWEYEAGEFQELREPAPEEMRVNQFKGNLQIMMENEQWYFGKLLAKKPTLLTYGDEGKDEISYCDTSAGHIVIDSSEFHSDSLDPKSTTIKTLRREMDGSLSIDTAHRRFRWRGDFGKVTRTLLNCKASAD